MCGAAAACIEEGDGDADIAVSACRAYPFLKSEARSIMKVVSYSML